VYGVHSLRSSGASVAARAAILGKLLMRHGGWRSESAKNMYIQEMEETLLGVSRELHLEDPFVTAFLCFSLGFFVFLHWDCVFQRRHFLSLSKLGSLHEHIQSCSPVPTSALLQSMV